MTDSGSILDKIIERQQLAEDASFNPSEMTGNLVKALSAKERDIITRRFGLNGSPPQTLEEIGKSHQITRERIRQIQVAAIKRVKAIEESRATLRSVEHTVTRVLEQAGGIMAEAALLEHLLAYADKSEQNRAALLFIISQLLDEKVDPVKPTEHVHPGWKLKVLSLDFVHQVLRTLHDIVHAGGKLLPTESVLQRFRAHPFFGEHRERLIPAGATLGSATEADLDRVILSYLTLSSAIEQNILGEWGLTHWTTVIPRRMGDKIYLILRQVGKPLHFTEIAETINTAKFDHKVAFPATIHNELILDERYVLVGRGIYALREWGYEPGTVSDVIAAVLQAAPGPLTRDEIVAAVTQRRIVRQSTIALALTNRERFTRTDDGYSLAVAVPTPATS